MLDDDDTLQKARTVSTGYEGNMMVAAKAKISGINVFWRQLESETLQAIIAQSRHYLLPLLRFNRSR